MTKFYKISLFIIFCFPLLTFGQLDTNILKIKAITNEPSFPNLFKSLTEFKESFHSEDIVGSLRFYSNNEKFRNYGFNICEYSLKFHKLLTENKGSITRDEYILTILFDEKDSTIFFRKLVLVTDYPKFKELKSIVFEYKETQFEKYFELHDSLFNTITTRDFKSPPFISNKHYGPLCSRHRSIQHEKMLLAVKNKQKDFLLSWIQSFNIEDKVHGAKGLYFIQKDGEVLTKNEQLLIKTVQNMKVNVRTDLGFRHIYLLLNDNRLDMEFEKYKGK